MEIRKGGISNVTREVTGCFNTLCKFVSCDIPTASSQDKKERKRRSKYVEYGLLEKKIDE